MRIATQQSTCDECGATIREGDKFIICLIGCTLCNHCQSKQKRFDVNEMHDYNDRVFRLIQDGTFDRLEQLIQEGKEEEALKLNDWIQGKINGAISTS